MNEESQIYLLLKYQYIFVLKIEKHLYSRNVRVCFV